MIKIYYCDVSKLNTENDMPEISQYRKEKLSKAKRISNKKQGLGAELLLNWAVKENLTNSHFPLDIKTGPYGKPYCDELPFSFSLSHSGNFSACAICEREIGLDIQQLSEYKENLARRSFAAQEREYIEASDDKDMAFTQIWSMKESFIKALGTGLHTPLDSFSVMPDKFVNVGNSDRYYIYSVFMENCFFSVCVKGDSISVPEITKLEL